MDLEYMLKDECRKRKERDKEIQILRAQLAEFRSENELLKQVELNVTSLHNTTLEEYAELKRQNDRLEQMLASLYKHIPTVKYVIDKIASLEEEK